MAPALRVIASVAKPGDSAAVFRYPKLLALAAGALSATGFAPLQLWPVTLACFALLIHLLYSASSWRGAFARMWLFAVAHFTVGLNWIAHAFTYQDSMPHWFGYGAVVGLSLYLAVFPALGAVVAHAFNRSSRAKSRGAGAEPEPRPSTSLGTSGFVLFFAATWIVTEWLRATVFTGFAWNPLGVIWVPTGGRYWASLVGTYGLSGMTMLFAGALLQATQSPTRRTVLTAVLFGVLMLRPTIERSYPSGTPIRIVQPDISQDEKQDDSAQVDHIRRLVAMSGAPTDRPRILLWPEAAIDNGFLLEEEPGLRRYLMKAIGRHDVLLTGGIALEYDRAGRAIGGRNSVFALGADSRIAARYDKAHLVPYGEYLPMRTILTPLGLSRLVPGDLDFWPGPGARTFDIPGIGPVGFQICYEIIFSGQVVDRAHRPRFLFNPSNDAWFGSWGPPQHLAQARLRAVEEGLPIIRATPTGISGLIDPHGRLLAQAGAHEQAVIDARLPQSLAPTPFARFGNLLPGLLALVLTAFAIVIRLRAR